MMKLKRLLTHVLMKSAFFSFMLSLSLMSSSVAFGGPSKQIEKQADEKIKSLYQKVHPKNLKDSSARIHWFSQQFLGQPYILGALGEGEKADFDQFPRYRTDGFDCLTYVTTVVSLSQANTLPGFKHCIRQIRYGNGVRAYINRNHFTSLDWNLNNQRKGIVEDITASIVDENHQPVALYSTTLINKPQWYQKKSMNDIRLLEKNPQLRKQQLEALKKQGATLPATKVKIAYLPLDKLINSKNELNMQLINQIPDGAIIEIVRPDWNLKEKIGTNLHVSHLGFFIKKQNGYYFRQASSIQNKICDVPLRDYLIQIRKSPTIKGINVQKVLINNGLCN